MNEPLISVIMSVYKEREEWLRAAVESILSQTYKNIEFIIINDCPERELNSVLLDEYAKNDSRIKIITNKVNSGLVSSLNIGLENATGEYIARMDADDIALYTRLECEMQYMAEQNCDIVSAYVEWIDENGKTVKSGSVRNYSPESVMRQLKFDDSVCHPTWLVRSTVYKKLGGYRTIDAAEDYDFLLRALSAGYRIGICDSVLLKYRINMSGISRRKPLRQMLTSKFLRRHINKLDSITQSDIDLYVNKRAGEKAETKYGKALAFLRIAAESGKLKGVWLILKALMTSVYIYDNILCMVAVRIVRLKYKCKEKQR